MSETTTPDLGGEQTPAPETQEQGHDRQERGFQTRRDRRIDFLLGRSKAAETRAEAAEREMAELRQRLATAEAARAGSDQSRATGEIAAAKAALRQAHADGDFDAVAEAQEKLTRATMIAEQAGHDKARADAVAKEPPRQPVQQQAEPSPTMQEWLETAEGRAWNETPIIKQAGARFDQMAVDKGLRRETPEYFAFVNARIRSAFPWAIDGDDDNGGEPAEPEAETPPARPQPMRAATPPAPRRNPATPTTTTRLPTLTAAERDFAVNVLGKTPQEFAAAKQARLQREGKA